MLLAGDLGGTKTLLGLFERTADRPAPVVVREFQTLAFASLPSIVLEFLRDVGADVSAVDAACFGVAGPIHQEWADLTNVPWRIGVAELRDAQLNPVVLLNDVEVVAHSLPALRSDELVVIHPGVRADHATCALITVGTGFGQGFLHRGVSWSAPMPSEGGHADFAARTPREIELLAYLTAKFGRVDQERVISGRGLANVSDFTHQGWCPLISPQTDTALLPAVVSRQAIERLCPACEEALWIVIGALGSAAGNAAIVSVARGGVYLGGGIAPKLLPALQSRVFLDAYLSKPPMTELLDSVPVYAILNPHAGLLGSAIVASGMCNAAVRS